METKIENEKEWLRSAVIPDMIKNGKLIENSREIIENANDVKICEIEIKFIGIEEAFMLTNCYRATVEFEFNGRRGKRFLVVKKTPPLPEEVFEAIQFRALFGNEIAMYTKILPSIEDFTKEPIIVPKYVFSDLQKNSAAIALEDFGTQGWRVAKSKYNLTLEHALIAVKFLGRFHGIGFAMRATKPKDFESIAGELKESRYASDITEDWVLANRAAVERLMKVSRELEPSIDEDFIDKLGKMLYNGHKYGKQRVHPREPFITLCHGDYLRNNVAFHYEEKERKEDNEEFPKEMLMFDLQTMRLGSPMIDLVVFLLLSTFTQVRHENFQLIFESYRNQLVESYEKFAKGKAPEFLCYESLLKEYVKFMPYGIQITSFFLQNLVAPENITAEELLVLQRSPEEITADMMTRGGAVVNQELSHQVREMFDLSKKCGVDIFEGIDF